MENVTKVLIVDDERMVQKAYQSYIAANGDRYAVAATIVSAADALLACRANPVDMILMDICTAEFENGMKAAAEIKKELPRIRIIITTSYKDMRQVILAKEYRLDGFWFKDQGDVELIEVMDRVVKGERVFPEEAPDVALGVAMFSDLTPAEAKVLYAMLEVTGNRQIAQKLGIEESTVKTHLKRICEKTGVSTKTELAILAANSKLALPKFRNRKFS